VVEGAQILPRGGATGGHPLVALRRVAEARADHAHHGLQEQQLDVAMQGMQSARSQLLSAKSHMQAALQRSAALKAAKRLRALRGRRNTAMVQEQENELPPQGGSPSA